MSSVLNDFKEWLGEYQPSSLYQQAIAMLEAYQDMELTDIEQAMGELVNKEQLAEVFANTNFGKVPARGVIMKDLPQVAAGFRVGHTSTICMQELNLIYQVKYATYNLTDKGKEYLNLIKKHKETLKNYGL